jgi:hypothetical protein
MKTHLEEILKSRFLIYDFFGFLDFRQARWFKQNHILSNIHILWKGTFWWELL